MSIIRYKKRLTRRIEWVVFAMCLLVATIFSLGTVYSINYIESETVQLNLGHLLSALIQQRIHHVPITAGYATSFYDGGRKGEHLPAWLSELTTGVNRLSHAGSDWYALTRDQDGHRYVLVQRSDALGWRQQHIYLAFFACWFICVFAGLLIGRWLVRMAIHPLIRLANDIRQIRYSSEQVALAPAYPDDEVGQLAASFDRTTEEILALLVRERAFTGGVSHELRSPLMVIKGASELLMSAGLSDRHQRVVRRIANACDQMDALVNAFLVLARDQQGAHPPLTRRKLESTVAEVVVQLESQTGVEKGIIRVSHHAQIEQLYPATLVTIAVSNLLRNSLAYSNGAPVDVRLFDGMIEVVDQAPLMGMADFTQMLAPLTRGHAGHQHEGLGLGLAIVKRICDFMGWSLEYRVERHRNCIRIVFEHYGQ